MAVAKGAIYECSTAPGDFPPLVVVLMDGKVIGEMMDGLTAMAARHGRALKMQNERYQIQAL